MISKKITVSKKTLNTKVTHQSYPPKPVAWMEENHQALGYVFLEARTHDTDTLSIDFSGQME